MAEHPNVGKIRRGFEVIEKRPMTAEDMAFVDDLFDENVVWTKQGGSQLAGVERGKQAVFAALGQVDAESGNTFRRDVRTVFADDEHAVCIMQIHAERRGNKADWGEVAVFKFTPEGRIIDFWGITEDLDKVDAFWAS